MALRDLFITAWLVTLLVMASGATGLVQNESLSVPTAHDSSSTFSVMLKLERLEAKIDSLEKRSAIDNDAIQNNMLKKTDLEEILTRIIMLAVTTEEGFSFLKENVENSWQQPQLDTEESAFRNVANKLNYTLSKKVQSALIQFFSPKSCKKKALVLYPFSTQYTVIYNKQFSGVDTPLLCDTVTDGGGWIVIQRRSTGDVDFFRNWASYKAGFGTPDGDFWLGNENIHRITNTGRYELRVDLEYKGESKYARYGKFVIDSEYDKYKLHIESYSGTAGDSLERQNGMKFSTFDNDNDLLNINCAIDYTGAWWYKNCHDSNLNGKWGKDEYKGARWKHFTNSESATFTEMKIRKVDR